MAILNKKSQFYNKLSSFFAIAVVLGLLSGFAGGLVASLAVTSYQNAQDATPANIAQDKEYAPITDEEVVAVRAVELVSPSVVSIVITKELSKISGLSGPNIFPFDDFFEFGFPFIIPEEEESPGENRKQEVGGGSGFIVSKNGLIVTNKHVVDDEEAEYTVILNDGRKFEARVLGKDPFNDLAVIKIETDDLPVVLLGDSDTIRIGQSVIAIGNALGEFRNTVTKGVISGINRRVVAGNGFGSSEVIEEAIQTDAAINPGNSGGPLVNLEGKVVGVNTAISRAGQLVGFAIPINTAKQMIISIQEFGRIVRPWLGVRYVLNNERIAEENDLSVSYGAILLPGRKVDELAVVPGSPADKAGLGANDIILEVNGERIEENHSLGRAIGEFRPGDSITMKILHDGEEKIIKAILGEFSND